MVRTFVTRSEATAANAAVAPLAISLATETDISAAFLAAQCAFAADCRITPVAEGRRVIVEVAAAVGAGAGRFRPAVELDVGAAGVVRSQRLGDDQEEVAEPAGEEGFLNGFDGLPFA